MTEIKDQETVQNENADNAAKIAALEADLAKEREEKENYRKGLLEREEKLKSFKQDEEKKDDDEDSSDWDEASKRFQNETIEKTRKIAEEAAMKAFENREEKKITNDFREANSNITDSDWEKILQNYTNTGDVKKSLERAWVITRFERGEIIDPKDQMINRAGEELRQLSSAGTGIGSRGEEEKLISGDAINIASKMRVSQDALKKEDDTLQAEILIG